MSHPILLDRLNLADLPDKDTKSAATTTTASSAPTSAVGGKDTKSAATATATAPAAASATATATATAATTTAKIGTATIACSSRLRAINARHSNIPSLTKTDDGASWRRFLTSRIPLAGNLTQETYPIVNGLLQAVHTAFAQEKDLVLSPDIVYLSMTRVIAAYIVKHAERLRNVVGVQHKGKQTLTVIHDGLSLGDDVTTASAKWATVFPQFRQLIVDRCVDSKTMQALRVEFSTTGELERLAGSIAMMDAMQGYFNYLTLTMCGISNIHLRGTVEDWRSLLTTLLPACEELGMTEWAASVRVPLQHIVSAFDATTPPDLDFWTSIYTYQSVSGGYDITGWIREFAVADATNGYTLGTQLSDFCATLSRVPFTWSYLGQTIPSEFVGGVGGVSAQDVAYIEPTVVWAVTRTKTQAETAAEAAAAIATATAAAVIPTLGAQFITYETPAAEAERITGCALHVHDRLRDADSCNCAVFRTSDNNGSCLWRRPTAPGEWFFNIPKTITYWLPDVPY